MFLKIENKEKCTFRIELRAIVAKLIGKCSLSRPKKAMDADLGIFVYFCLSLKKFKYFKLYSNFLNYLSKEYLCRGKLLEVSRPPKRKHSGNDRNN